MAEIGRRLDYAWRVLATGFGFLTFTLMGLLFRFAACPLLTLFIRTPRRRELSARRIVQVSFAFFIGLMQALGPLRLTVKGREKLQQPGLLLCPSHPTLIDVVILMSMIRNANCLVKANLLDSYALRAPIVTTGYIANDSGPDLINACAASLAARDTLIIFPEGTRSTPGVLPHLKHGAAAAALASRHDITPVRITCEPPALMKGIHWYTIPPRRMQISVTVCDSIPIGPFLAVEAAEGRPKAVRRLNEALAAQLFPINSDHRHE